MAKLERTLRTDFDALLQYLDDGIIRGSVSASREDGSDFYEGSVRCAVRVYERYSAMSVNRVSMNLTLFGLNGRVQLSAITSGGSEALFFKVNTFGESAFLDKLDSLLDKYERNRGM